MMLKDRDTSINLNFPKMLEKSDLIYKEKCSFANAILLTTLFYIIVGTLIREIKS